jgi:hypothetical protein
MQSRFKWITFDVSDLLPPGWESDIKAATAEADIREFPKTPLLTKEAADVDGIERGRVHAHDVQRTLPWLCELYHNDFLDLANEAWPETVATARDERYGVVLNVQRGTTMRFECHIDSNPLTGLLFLTDHEVGGELVIARDPAAVGSDEIEQDYSLIRPHAGHLAFFDARHHPHYTRPLKSPSDTRIIAAMNFYTDSFPESTRPKGLNQHLYGDPE